MRIGFKTVYDRMLYNLNKLTDDIFTLQNQTASGLKYSKPSDSPVSLVRALSYRDSLKEIDRYQNSIQEGKAYLNTMENALDGLEDVVMRAKELALQAANDDLNADDRQAIATELDSLLDEALALANTKHGQRYVFAGNKPTGYSEGHLPFEKQTIQLAEDKVRVSILYNGGDEDFYMGYAPNQKILVGKNGKETILDSGLFEALIGLKKTVEANNVANPSEEVEDIGVHIDRLDKVLDHIINERADLGARVDYLDMKKNLYTDLKTTIQENLTNTQEVDLLDVTTKLAAKQNAYEAALLATSKVSQMSLVNFLS